MLSLAKPSHSQLRDYLWQHRELPLTYPNSAATKHGPGALPGGYTCGYSRVRLGSGRACYLRAKQAMRDWKMFPSDFVELVWPCPIEAGRVVATLFRAPGFWTLNPCRIVYTIDSAAKREQFGFAYGTVGRHLASGEERFLVEYNHDDESVWYEIYCFSNANHWLSRVAYPYFRIQQHRFRIQSSRSMQQAVQSTTAQPVSV